MDKEEDEPLTPAGRLFLNPQMNQIISCAIGVKNPINIDSVKSELTNSIMLHHPRFTSLLVNDSKGKEHWRKTKVKVDQHVIIRHQPFTSDQDSDEDVVNDYLADLAVSCPLPTDKPLWDLHLLMAHNCFVFRVHHALGDGISLMSMFLTLCRRVDDPGQRPTILGVGSSATGQRSRWGLGRVVKVLWYSVVFLLEFVLRTLWWRDKKTAVSGGAGVELWPRKLVTAKFKIDDMKTVKKAVANATINDILFGVLSSGLSKYLEIRSTKGLREGLQITGVAMVNLRKQPGLQDFSKMMESKSSGISWGNKFGMILIPVCYNKGCADPLQFVKRAKAILDKKKLSLEAICSYKIGDFVMSWFGPKFASLLNYRILSNTTFTISNVIGPQEEITIIGNPVDYIRANNTSLPHALMINMLSYAGKADMQILVAKDIIPDPKVLAKCFEDSLLEMKEAAEADIETNK
ncbi:acyltransferase [Lithospermum erythrorhizon]|uniref:Acyltransferase n=1 Tax=Lithospermum erythrorhizon TaxID=34254 RepID=A0AAV3QT49_LITER